MTQARARGAPPGTKVEYYYGFIVSRKDRVLTFLLFAVVFGVPRVSMAQTPSPLQEWQYSGGTILERLFQPNAPDWHTVAGVAADNRPLYDGAERYRTLGGPVISVRYQDVAFASVGEGLGYNFVRGDHYRVGIALGYDLGRHQEEDLDHLRGLGDVGRAATVKMFGSYVVSKEFPLIFRADLRQFVGGADGVTGDAGFYMPLPGSSKRLIMFAGPSVTFADRLYMQKEFGVTPAQSGNSGYEQYQARTGIYAGGFGFSATSFITDHWLVNADAAIDHLFGSAAESPITQRRTQRVITFSICYTW